MSTLIHKVEISRNKIFRNKRKCPHYTAKG